jgi:hypothetical protein
MRPTFIALLLLGLLPGAARPAINPAEYQRVASDVLRIRETARVVELRGEGDAQWRRVTLVGVVVDQRGDAASRVGETVVIDFTVDLGARARAAAEHARRNGNRPGPQFMHEPDPPVPDAEGSYWANLAPAGSRLGNVNRHAGAVAGIGDIQYSGATFVPVSGQYSFMAPPR